MGRDQTKRRFPLLDQTQPISSGTSRLPAIFLSLSLLNRRSLAWPADVHALEFSSPPREHTEKSPGDYYYARIRLRRYIGADCLCLPSVITRRTCVIGLIAGCSFLFLMFFTNKRLRHTDRQGGMMIF